MLEVRALTKHFGGLLANDGVDLNLAVGQVHVVIGPNGAGKSTLINILSGDLRPTAGSVRLDGRDITGLPADRVSRLGIGRSYQKTNIFQSFTVFENCRLAAQSRAPHPLRLFSRASGYAETNALAARAIEQAELQGREDRVASTLSHGEQRQLEIAMSLATAPKVLLLDEPLAGMGAEESQRMVALINKLKSDHAILLVEHDMDAVFAVADVLTVMVEGRVLATGSADQIRDNEEVQRAYLGTEQDDG
ncbi:MAG: ABC transporter ATP-binding protein [Burkholderiales bacterium]|nr:MAG: ABC transporter ATP-binding protein [Burkholderiales bacterium]